VDSLTSGDRCEGSFSGALGWGVPAYQPTSVSLAIGLDFLEDDGAVSITNLFAHPGSGTVTDIVPDSVAWEFVPTAPASAATGERRLSLWDFVPFPKPPVGSIKLDDVPFTRRAPPQ
jgi:hypothetical protein